MNTINLCPKLTDRNGYEKPIKRVNVLWDRLNVLKCCQHEIICTTNSIKTIPKPKKEKEQEGKEKKIALRRNKVSLGYFHLNSIRIASKRGIVENRRNQNLRASF